MNFCTLILKLFRRKIRPISCTYVLSYLPSPIASDPFIMRRRLHESTNILHREVNSIFLLTNFFNCCNNMNIIDIFIMNFEGDEIKKLTPMGHHPQASSLHPYLHS